MKKGYWLPIIPLVILMCALSGGRLFANNEGASQLSKAQTAQKLQNLHIPFIVNEGQTDERVKFYANTFGGSVYVTKDGEIVYVLPKVVKESETQSSHTDKELAPKEQFQHNEAVALTEVVVNGKCTEITGEGKSVTQVNYFTENDQSKWKTNIPTYETANLGEVYAGIDLKLKAYGDNVEKLFTVKPNAAPETIRLKLSGAKALKVNKDGQLEVRTALGAVKFTRPVAYQEIDGKRVEVEVEYKVKSLQLKDENTKCETRNTKLKTLNSKLASTKPNPQSEIANSNRKSKIVNRKLEYGFKVASYDKSKDLVIDPLLASTYLGGSGTDYVKSLALDAGGNVYVTGHTLSTNFPTTTGAWDTTFNAYPLYSRNIKISTIYGSENIY